MGFAWRISPCHTTVNLYLCCQLISNGYEIIVASRNIWGLGNGGQEKKVSFFKKDLVKNMHGIWWKNVRHKNIIYTSIPYPYPYPNSENSFPEITVYYCYSFEKIDDTYIKNGPIAPGKIWKTGKKLAISIFFRTLKLGRKREMVSRRNKKSTSI